MKFSVSALIAVSYGVNCVEGNMSIRGNNKSATQRRLMKEARRVQNNNQQYYGNGQQDYGEDSYLMGYSLKLLTCQSGEQTINYETGETDSSTVVFRLCPVDTCSDDGAGGCYEGYGDYTVGLSTFLEAYMEGQANDGQQQQQQGQGQYNYYNGNGNGMVYYNAYGQEFNVQEYARECREINMEELNGQNNGNGAYGNYNNGQNAYYAYQNQGLYVGPTCTSDGAGIRLGLFIDQYCSYENTDVSFNDLTGGAFANMPYFNDDSSSSLVPTTCLQCWGMNGNWDYEVNQACQRSYESASTRCETEMDYTYGGYGYGRNQQGCSYITGLLSGTGISTTSSDAEAEYKAVNGEDDEEVTSSASKLTWDLSDEMFWDLIVLILGLGGGVLMALWCIGNKTQTVKLSPAKTIKEGAKTAAMGTKVVIAETVAAVKQSLSRASTKDETANTTDEYNEMDEKDVSPSKSGDGSYKAPAQSNVSESKEPATSTSTVSVLDFFSLSGSAIKTKDQTPSATAKSTPPVADDAVEDEAFEIELKKAKGARKMFGKMKDKMAKEEEAAAAAAKKKKTSSR